MKMNNNINSTSLNSKIKKSQLKNLNADSINSVEIIEQTPGSTVLATCSDRDITLYNVSSQTKHSLYPAFNHEGADAAATKSSATRRPRSHDHANDDEITCLKSCNTTVGSSSLLASNGRLVMLFDLNEQPRLVDKLKFNQDTINCVEFSPASNVGSAGTVLTLGDDAGEIKIVDMRESKSATRHVPSLTLRNTLKGHKNICYCLKYHPSRPHELFSGSFDCSVIKWDLRNPKTKLAASKDLTPLSNELASVTSVHPMTPSFVHSLFVATPLTDDSTSSANAMLLCGLENGLCLALDTDSLSLCSYRQIGLNQAVTQMVEFESSSRRFGEKSLIATGGDSKQIEFIYFLKQQTSSRVDESGTAAAAASSQDNEEAKEPEFGIESVESLKLEHGFKINCLKYASTSATLYVSDTTQNLTSYDFNDSCFLSFD